MRKPAQRTKPRLAKEKQFPAPVDGWIANVNLASPDARKPDGSKLYGAAVLDNAFPTATGIRVRGGSIVYTILDDFKDVKSLFTYVNGNNRKLFAASATSIFDITTVAAFGFLVDDLGNKLIDDLGNFLADGLASATLGSLTGGDWVSVQFATPGGVFLRLVNGLDTSLVYDGASFGTSPAITGVTSASLSFVWAHASRLWFVEKNSLNAWYLPVDSVGGVATKYPLGGVFTRGGSLLFGASWSLESGSGPTDLCAFFTDEGEVAVYQGNDPALVSTFAKVGVYRIGRPRGPKAVIRAGGDLVVATDVGFVPLSVAIQRDYAALSPSAVSYRIETAWNELVAKRSFANWHAEIWPSKQMVVVAPPTQTGTQAQVLVTNARTGAWARYTGWDATCIVTFGDRLFFGSKAGVVIEAEVTGRDQDAAYTAVWAPLYDPLKAPASLKTGLMARATYRAPSQIEVKLSLQVDYDLSLPAPPNDIAAPSTAIWGAAVWGAAVWSAPVPRRTFQDWQSAGGAGYAISVAAQITSSSLSAPDVEYVQTELTYDQGDVMS